MRATSCPVVGIVGWSGAGKTTFLVRLIAELKRRGYCVGTVKHSSHADVSVDAPGSDSWRHMEAGADVVALASPRRLAVTQRLTGDIALADVVAQMPAVDIILVEGYKRTPMPKIEISRAGREEALISRPEELIALVTDRAWDVSVPHFALDDAAGVAALLVERFLRLPS